MPTTILLQINLSLSDYKFPLLSFFTSFVVAMVCIPPVIMLVNKFRLYDIPDARKEHKLPTPTLGGIAIIAGMTAALSLWFHFTFIPEIVTCFFCMGLLFAMGITDDLKDLPAKYKFVVEIALATLIALSGVRITSFEGMFGIEKLSLSAQYIFTVLTIVGVTNALNLIDGIDGLAGSLSFMSLVMLGFILQITGDKSFALIAFALAGGVLAFLYFNMNPARIFMGDTGSLVLGFVIAILCIRVMQVNVNAAQPLFKSAPVFALSTVLIPVFDTIRVFATRIWKGKSPFTPDRTHIHHLLTNNGFNHATSSRAIVVIHALIMMEAYWLKNLRPEIALLILLITISAVIFIFKRVVPAPKIQGKAKSFFSLRFIKP